MDTAPILELGEEFRLHPGYAMKVERRQNYKKTIFLAEKVVISEILVLKTLVSRLDYLHN